MVKLVYPKKGGNNMHIQDLMPSEVIKLREDVTLNSYLAIDYSNRFGIDENEVYYFFDGYLDFLLDLGKGMELFDAIEKYDNRENLLGFWNDYRYATTR